MKLIRLGINKFRHTDMAYTLRDVEDFARIGREVIIVDDDDIDITKEVLIEIAFRKKNEMRDYLEYTIRTDQLLELIESGGADNWLSKRKRGF